MDSVPKEKQNGKGKDDKSSSIKVEQVYMKRHMGLIQACGIIIGQVIGTGIFLTPKGVTRNIGSVGASLIVWAFCGINNTLGSLMYAEMGAVLPKAGGEYAFVMESFGPLAAFTTLWANAFVVRPVSFVIMGRVAGQYVIQLFFPNCELPEVIAPLFGMWLICKYLHTIFATYCVCIFIIHPCDPTVVICYLIWPCDILLSVSPTSYQIALL